MNNENTQITYKHGLIARIFHWGFLGLFAYGIYKGLDDVNQLADPALLNFELMFASGFLGVILARFLFMKKRQSSLPEGTSKPVSLLAKIVHLGLYIFPALIALSGLAIGSLYASGVTNGTLIDAVIGFHDFTINASYVLIGGHVAAAIGHRLMKDGVWSSMVPIFKEKPSKT